MGFRFRLGKHKNKLIALLLVLSLIASVVAFHPLEARADNNIVYSYYDWLYSVAKSQGYEMKWIDPEHCDYPATSKALALTFQYIDHKLGLYGPLDNYDPVENLKVNLEDIGWYFKSRISRMTEEGIYLTSEAWDAFKQFFSDVANDEPISNSYSRDFSSFSQYVNDVLGYDANLEYNSRYDKFLKSDHMAIVRLSYSGGFFDYVVTPKYSYSFTGWHYVVSDNYIFVSCSDQEDMLYDGFQFFNKQMNVPWFTNGSLLFQQKANKDEKIEILATDFKKNAGTVSSVYSPYIRYTPTGTAPAQVPDIIPWSTFPDHEVIDDDTKIYIPVESPDVETPTETPEAPTETPEQPTETPGDSDDGDDISNLVPIFPDIDIDPNIHLPDDWINPPDIDLDPDVDVDTPSPGGKIPHLQKLKEKFPFCIPFDLVLLFKMLNKKPKAPKWEFKHDFQIGDSKPYTWEVVVDMAEYDKYVQIFREGFFLLFLVGLFFVTKKLISWQTG